jgi:hypothetical protein
MKEVVSILDKIARDPRLEIIAQVCPIGDAKAEEVRRLL